jgi:hypothetical protein
MNPVYFPFTVLSAANIMNMAALFSSLTVFRVTNGPLPQEMAMGPAEGFLCLRIPVSGEEKKLESVVKDYKNWADLHQDSPAMFFKSRVDAVPFYSESSVSRIRMDIQRQQPGVNSGSAAIDLKSLDRLFAARLFLRIAEEHDIAEIHAHEDLDAVEKMQQAIFNDLKGDPEDRFALKGLFLKSVMEDRGSHMTLERVKAWSIPAFSREEASGVYVTDSPAVMDFLKEQNDDMKPALVLDGIPVRPEKDDDVEGFKHKLSEFLERLAKAPDFSCAEPTPDVPERRSDEKTVSLTVYWVSGKSPAEYFGRLFTEPRDMVGKPLDRIFQNTVVCLVEIKP